MQRIFQPIRDAFAGAAVVDDSNLETSTFNPQPNESDAFSDASTAAAYMPLGEIGGAMFPASQLERFQQVGGAVYPSIRPFGTATASVRTDAQLARRLVQQHQRRRRQHDTLVFVVCRALLSPVVPWFPILRTVVPRCLLDVAAGPTRMEERSLDHAVVADTVVCMAFHCHLPILAIATRDSAGGHRIQLYDVTFERMMPVVLTHAFQDQAIHAMAWKPYARDCLAVGCDGGVLMWSLCMRGAASAVPGGGGASTGHNQRPSGRGRTVLSSADREETTSYYGPMWASISDATPCSVWYPCTPRAPTSSLAFSSSGQYLACGSELAIAMHVHDVSQAPHRALLVENIALEGSTSALCFFEDDSTIIRAIRSQRCLKLLLTTDGFRADTIATERPVVDVVRLASMSPATSGDCELFVLQYEQTEGVALVRFVCDRKHGASVMLVVALLSTGVCRGVGGAVAGMVAHGKRLYLRVSSGHVVVVAAYGSIGSGGGVSVQGVGVVAATQALPTMAASPSFHKGSLLAVTHGDTIRLVPSYYAR